MTIGIDLENDNGCNIVCNILESGNYEVVSLRNHNNELGMYAAAVDAGIDMFISSDEDLVNYFADNGIPSLLSIT